MWHLLDCSALTTSWSLYHTQNVRTGQFLQHRIHKMSVCKIGSKGHQAAIHQYANGTLQSLQTQREQQLT